MELVELKIMMNEYGNLYAVLPNGDKRKIIADSCGNPFYSIVRTIGDKR